MIKLTKTNLIAAGLLLSLPIASINLPSAIAALEAGDPPTISQNQFLNKTLGQAAVDDDQNIYMPIEEYSTGDHFNTFTLSAATDFIEFSNEFNTTGGSVTATETTPAGQYILGGDFENIQTPSSSAFVPSDGLVILDDEFGVIKNFNNDFEFDPESDSTGSKFREIVSYNNKLYIVTTAISYNETPISGIVCLDADYNVCAGWEGIQNGDFPTLENFDFGNKTIRILPFADKVFGMVQSANTGQLVSESAFILIEDELGVTEYFSGSGDLFFDEILSATSYGSDPFSYSLIVDVEGDIYPYIQFVYNDTLYQIANDRGNLSYNPPLDLEAEFGENYTLIFDDDNIQELNTQNPGNAYVIYSDNPNPKLVTISTDPANGNSLLSAPLDLIGINYSEFSSPKIIDVNPVKILYDSKVINTQDGSVTELERNVITSGRSNLLNKDLLLVSNNSELEILDNQAIVETNIIKVTPEGTVSNLDMGIRNADKPDQPYYVGDLGYYNDRLYFYLVGAANTESELLANGIYSYDLLTEELELFAQTAIDLEGYQFSGGRMLIDSGKLYSRESYTNFDPYDELYELKKFDLATGQEDPLYAEETSSVSISTFEFSPQNTIIVGGEIYTIYYSGVLSDSIIAKLDTNGEYSETPTNTNIENVQLSKLSDDAFAIVYYDPEIQKSRIVIESLTPEAETRYSQLESILFTTADEDADNIFVVLAEQDDKVYISGYFGTVEFQDQIINISKAPFVVFDLETQEILEEATTAFNQNVFSINDEPLVFYLALNNKRFTAYVDGDTPFQLIEGDLRTSYGNTVFLDYVPVPEVVDPEEPEEPTPTPTRGGGGGSGSKAKDDTAPSTDLSNLTYEQEKALVLEKKIITQTPSSLANKCEALVILSRTQNWPLDKSLVPDQFTDTATWCEPAARYATKAGIVQGRTPTTLGMDTPVTRDEFVTMLVRSLKVSEIDLNSAPQAKFTDTLTPWATKYINWASAQKIVKGFADGQFKGQEGITKYDLAIMALRSQSIKTVSN